MNRTLLTAVAALLSLLFAVPASAHHAFAAEFDANKKVKVSGAVTRLEWTNPHAWLYIDAKDENGNVTSWSFELGSPNALIRRGWRRTSLKAGDQVSIEGFAAKDGTNTANAHNVTLPDGRTIFAGSQNTPSEPDK